MNIVCECGHVEEVKWSKLIKVFGSTLSIGGIVAWKTFFFAGTGRAWSLALGMVLLGTLTLAYQNQIVKLINKFYPCPKCNKTDKWTLQS